MAQSFYDLSSEIWRTELPPRQTSQEATKIIQIFQLYYSHENDQSTCKWKTYFDIWPFSFKGKCTRYCSKVNKHNSQISFRLNWPLPNSREKFSPARLPISVLGWKQIHHYDERRVRHGWIELSILLKPVGGVRVDKSFCHYNKRGSPRYNLNYLRITDHQNQLISFCQYLNTFSTDTSHPYVLFFHLNTQQCLLQWVCTT